MPDREHSDVTEVLCRFWAGKRVALLATRFGGVANTNIAELTACGAEVACVIAPSWTGGGDLPANRVWDCHQRGMHMNPREFEAWLRSSPTAVSEWLDEIDPERALLVLGTTFTDYSELCHRPVHGRRLPEWVRWEDKTRIEDMWRELGIRSPAHVVLSVDDPAIADRAAACDRGLGVVVATDNSVRINMGSRDLRWVRHTCMLDATIEKLKPRTRRIRIAAFTRGVPCSVPGLVLPSGVAVFDPIEDITLRSAQTGEFLFCGSSTWWRPDSAASAEARQVARRIGMHLADTISYRGFYSVDGLLSDEGFYVTELNPRYASGLGLRHAWPSFPVNLFHRAVQMDVAGMAAIDWRTVEASFRAAIRAAPSMSVNLPLPTSPARDEGLSRLVVRTADPPGHDAVERVVTCSFEGPNVRLISVEPRPASGLLGLVAEAVVSQAGASGLLSHVSTDAMTSVRGTSLTYAANGE
jgi:hypothetical protein